MGDSNVENEKKPRLTNKQIFVEIVGWAGTALILGSYAANVMGGMDAADTAYKVMNIVGALGVGYNSLEKRAWPSVGLNLAWMTIGLIGFFRG